VVKVQPGQKTSEEAAQERAERDDKKQSDWWLVKLTGALAIIGAIQIVVFGLQAKRLRETVEAMGRQEKLTEASVEEMGRAADAAAKSADVSEQAMRTTQRALVFGKLSSVTTLVKAGGPVARYTLTAEWDNFGVTPATEMQAYIAWQTAPKGDPPPDFSIPAQTEHLTVLGPRRVNLSAPIDVSVATMVESWQNKRDFFVWARVEYRDVFSTTTHHHQFCLIVEWPSNPAMPGEGPLFRVVGPQNTFA
jgi:hypothetical protein